MEKNSRDYHGGSVVKNPPPMQGSQVQSLVRELRDPTSSEHSAQVLQPEKPQR